MNNPRRTTLLQRGRGLTEAGAAAVATRSTIEPRSRVERELRQAVMRLLHTTLDSPEENDQQRRHSPHQVTAMVTFSRRQQGENNDGDRTSSGKGTPNADHVMTASMIAREGGLLSMGQRTTAHFRLPTGRVIRALLIRTENVYSVPVKK